MMIILIEHNNVNIYRYSLKNRTDTSKYYI